MKAQVPEAGNVIPEYGATYHISSPDFKTDTSSVLKVVFDVNRNFASNEPNKLIETAARFLNMHEKAGVDLRNMEIALVVHGSAINDVLRDKFYTKKYPQTNSNPNLPLLDELTKHGVQVILCGQSAKHHKVTTEKAANDVKIALSAMTALVQLQNMDYRIINF
ncbi:DsrE family protein [Salegentibacter sp. JZCK2]|uniref:DsrE family protein n=1 Tax=Salegentibacter tibetensis TaxID=2873600 RepID=UPI001CC9A23B|nr:DsrE family protein [Salegentibacter tibetensis]MBZ9731062.1 DsrE family protein [Salegentibacter tibetensis]